MGKETKNEEPKKDDGSARDLLAELVWLPLDEETTAGQHGLTTLLLQRFSQTIPDFKRTVAQVLVDRLLERALEGHHQSLEVIMTRIDGDAKSNGPAVKSVQPALKFDAQDAERMLDASIPAHEQLPGD
jgi:hypothetical protein